VVELHLQQKENLKKKMKRTKKQQKHKQKHKQKGGGELFFQDEADADADAEADARETRSPLTYPTPRTLFDVRE
jgi:hypothetical protein